MSRFQDLRNPKIRNVYNMMYLFLKHALERSSDSSLMKFDKIVDNVGSIIFEELVRIGEGERRWGYGYRFW